MASKCGAVEELYTKPELRALKQVMEMGFGRDAVMLALVRARWHVDEAVLQLTAEPAEEPQPPEDQPAQQGAIASSSLPPETPSATSTGLTAQAPGPQAPGLPATGPPLELGYLVLRTPEGQEQLRGRHRVTWAGLMSRFGLHPSNWSANKRGWYVRLWEHEAAALI